MQDEMKIVDPVKVHEARSCAVKDVADAKKLTTMIQMMLRQVASLQQ